MTRMIFICALLLGACASKSHKANQAPEHPIASECMIFDAQGNLRWSYPSWLCYFYPDGRFITATDNSIMLRGRGLEVLWEKNIPVHHMISVASNGDILTLGSELYPIAGRKFTSLIEVDWDLHKTEIKPLTALDSKEKFRADKIIRLNPAGQVVAEMELAGADNYPMPRLIHTVAGPSKSHPYEISHANSIYEIPPNASRLSEFKAGNVIVNDFLNHVIFVTDPNLKQILWRLNYEKLGWYMVHDVSVMNNGHLLLFKNLNFPGVGPSSLEEYDPVAEKVVWRYERSDINAFTKGSVQALPAGRFLFSHVSEKKSLVELISREGKILWSLDLSPHTDIEMQGAYLLPLENFLRNNNQHQTVQDYSDLRFTPLAAKSSTLKIKKFPSMTELEVRNELNNQATTLRKYLAKQIDPYHGESTVTSACNIPGRGQDQIQEDAHEIRLKFLLVTSPQYAIDCYGTSTDRQFDQRIFLYCKKTRSFYEINNYSPLSPQPPNDRLAQCGAIAE